MAAAISALNAKIRSHPVLNYVCSTHFWGPVSNFGIPIAAVLDTQKDPELFVPFPPPPEIPPLPPAAFLSAQFQPLPPLSASEQTDGTRISGRMTAALTLYSATFMRYSMAVTPQNYLLFACHFINFGSQGAQGYRYLRYWNWGGREASLEARAKEGMTAMKAEGEGLLAQAKEGMSSVEEKSKVLAGEAKAKAVELKDKVVR